MSPDLIRTLERFRRGLLTRPDAAAPILALYGIETEGHKQETLAEMIKELSAQELLALLGHALSETTEH